MASGAKVQLANIHALVKDWKMADSFTWATLSQVTEC